MTDKKARIKYDPSMDRVTVGPVELTGDELRALVAEHKLKTAKNKGKPKAAKNKSVEDNGVLGLEDVQGPQPKRYT